MYYHEGPNKKYGGFIGMTFSVWHIIITISWIVFSTCLTPLLLYFKATFFYLGGYPATSAKTCTLFFKLSQSVWKIDTLCWFSTNRAFIFYREVVYWRRTYIDHGHLSVSCMSVNLSSLSNWLNILNSFSTKSYHFSYKVTVDDQ